MVITHLCGCKELGRKLLMSDTAVALLFSFPLFPLFLFFLSVSFCHFWTQFYLLLHKTEKKTCQSAFWGVSPLHVCVQDTKIASLERNIRDLEDEIQMLKANGLLNTEDREEEIKQMEVYKNHSKFMKTKVNTVRLCMKCRSCWRTNTIESFGTQRERAVQIYENAKLSWWVCLCFSI